jgi:hypothetical protein
MLNGSMKLALHKSVKLALIEVVKDYSSLLSHHSGLTQMLQILIAKGILITC